MANPYNDQRYALARAMREQKQTQQGLAPLAPAPSAAGLAYGRQAASMASKNPSLRDAIDAIGQGKTQAPKGLLGSVLGNPIVHAGLKAAETLTLPARVVTSTVREAVDAIDGNKNTKASFGDFSSQIKDPKFRVGTAFNIDTGSKFVDGALGFIGDVALDPITYMTFGAGTIGGYAGRMDLATRILNTGDSALAAAVAREGRSALIGQASKLEQVGANKFGVYMFGKRIKVGVNQTGIRIPMTGQIAQVGEKFLSKTRLGITDTKAGEWLQKMTMPKDFLEARLAVARGTASPNVAEGLLQNLKAGAVQKAFRGSAFNTLTNEVEGILKQETDLGNLESYRNSLYRFMQDPSLLNTASDAEVAGFNIWQPWLAKQAQAVQDGFKSIDPTADVMMRTNYFPQVLTDEGIRYSRSETRYGQQLREVLMADPLANPDSFTPRSLVPGKKFFNETLKPEHMNIDALNKIANDGGFVGNFFETDVVVAMKKYTSDLADEFGIIERNRHLTESGFFKQIEEQRVLETSVNTDDIAAARSRVKEIKDSMDGAHSDMLTKNDELINTLKTAYNNNVMNIHTVEETATLIEDALRQHQTWVSGTKAAIEEAKNKLTVLHGPISEIGAANVSDSFPATLLPVLGQYDSILNEVAVYESRINDLITQGAQEVGGSYLLADSIDTLKQSMIDLTDSVQLKIESINSATEMSNVLESVWDSVSAGGRPRGTAEEVDFFKEIRGILGYGAAKSPSQQLKNITKQIKPPGVTKVVKKGAKAGEEIIAKDFKSFVDSPEFTSLFNEISGGVSAGDAPISLDRLKRISLKDHIDSLNSLLSKEISLTEMRTQAAYAVARDAHLYGGELPPTLQKFYKSLMKDLKTSAEVDSIAKRLSKKKTNANLTAFRGRWDAPMRQATQMQEGVSMFETLKTMLQRGGAVERALMDNPNSGLQSGLNFVDNGISIHPFTEDHVSLIASQAALLGHNEDDVLVVLGQYIDNAKALLGTDSPSIGDLNNAIDGKLSELYSQMDIPKFEFGAGKLKKGTVLSERRVLTARDVLKEHPVALAEAKKIDKANAGDYLVPGMSVDDARIGLSASLMKYVSVSDAVSKFEALSNSFAAHGLNVPEEMWHGILKTTHNKFGQGIGQKMSQLGQVEDLLKEMQTDYHKIFAAGGKSQHDAFVEAYTTALSKNGGENLREVIGKHLNTLDQDGNPMLLDPVDMALKIKSLTSVERGLASGVSAGTITAAEKALATQKLKSYFKDVVIPWAKQVDPSESASVEGAKRVLKRFVDGTNAKAVAESVSPLSVRAESRSVEKWFNQFFDVVKPIDSYDQAGRLIRSQSIEKGLLSNTYDAYSKHYSFFNDLTDGYLDPQSFFDYYSGASRIAPGDTPSSYGLQMARHAKNIQETVDRLVGEQLVKENRSLLKTATSASDSAYRAKQVQAAFKDPNLSDAALKDLGFTKDMKAARNATLAHQAHVATGGYAKALRDKETVSFLDNAAVYDFHLFDEGFVVGNNPVPVYQDTIKDVQRAATVGKREDLAKALQDVSDEENRIILDINRKYVLDQKEIVTGGVPSNQIKFKSVEARTAYKREMAAFQSRTKPSFDARRAAIQRDLDELPVIANDTVTMPEGQAPAFTPRARTQIGTRNEPVFAKMPDGQRIVFSRAESESLFTTPLLPLEVKALRGEIRLIKSRLSEVDRLSAVYKNNNARLVGLDREAESLAASLLPLEHKLLVSDISTRQMALYKATELVHGGHWSANTAEGRTNFLQGWSNLDTAYKPKRGKIQKGIKPTEQISNPATDLKTNSTLSHYINRDNVKHGVTAPVVGRTRTEWEKTQTLIESLSQNTESASKQVLDFAELKDAEVLANQSIVDSGLHYTPSRYKSASDVGTRRNSLQSSWGRTKEAALVQQEQELAKQASLNKTVQAVNSNSKLLQKTASDAQAAADASTIQLDELQQALRDSSRAISALESKAVDVAGIKKVVDVTDVGPRASYVVGNKTYLIPSLTEILSDPVKWSKPYLGPSARGATPGAKYKLFDQLTKPVMKPTFTDVKQLAMHEQAAFAMQMAHQAFDEFDVLGVKQLQLSNAGERITEIQNLLTSHMSDANTLSNSLKSARDALKVEQQMAQKELTAVSLEKAIGADVSVVTSGGKRINVSQLETKQDFYQFAEEIKQLYGSNLTPEQILSNPNNLISTLKQRQSLFDQLDLNGLWNADLAKNIEQWKFQNNDVMRSIVKNADDPEGMAVTAALTQAHVAEGRFLSEQLRLGAAQKNLSVALTPKETEKMVKQLADGFVSAGSTFNLPGLSVNKEVANIITNVARISDGRTARELGQFLSKYTSFFKAYSTLSPGFHVRNAMSNTFQLFAAGTEAKNMIEGLRLYTGFGEALRRGGNLEDWLMTVPEALRPQAKIAMDVHMALGGGKVEEAFSEFLSTTKGTLSDNPLTRGSRKLGNRVEGSARFTLAFDSAQKGMDFYSSFNKTKRFLFDYNQTSALDDSVKNIVPFWTWMSRNLPLQLSNQWTNPKPYAIYNHFSENFGIGENEVVPQWMRDQGALSIGGGNYITPDIPSLKAQEMVAQLASPKKMISYVNPLMRVPLELAGGTKFFNDSKFSDKYTVLEGKWTPFIPLLAAMGQVQTNDKGQYVTSDKSIYGLTSMIPTLGQGERIFPSSDVSGGDGYAFQRYLGIPIRKVDAKAKDNVMKQQLNQLLAMQAKQQRMNEAG